MHKFVCVCVCLCACVDATVAWSTEMGRASVRSPALTLDSENVVRTDLRPM